VKLTKEQIDAAARYNGKIGARVGPDELAILAAEWQEHHGLTVDGKYGPATEVSVVNYMDGYVASSAPPVQLADSGTFDGPLKQIPRNRREVYQVYGNPGTSKVDKSWERANIVKAKTLPGTWEGNGHYIHRLVEPYLREALRRCELAGCLGYINRIGCHVFRHQRHDPKRPLSYHSWGIAVDINAADNSGKTLRDYPEPWSPAWTTLWTKGVPSELVHAFESVGWTWGGRWHGYVDPMHMELVTRGANQ
jgi:hypothetical protein